MHIKYNKYTLSVQNQIGKTWASESMSSQKVPQFTTFYTNIIDL